MTQDNHDTQQERQQSRHAQFFKKIFSRPDYARDLLRHALPAALHSQLDLDSLHMSPDTYVDETLKEHLADLVIQVVTKSGTTCYVYLLLEHKSTPEQLVGLQLLRYMALQWHKLQQDKKLYHNKLPPIVPLVIYQGQQPWPHSCRFQDSVDLPDDNFRAYVPDFTFGLFDTGQVNTEHLYDTLIVKYYTAISRSLDSPHMRQLLPELVGAFTETLQADEAVEMIAIFIRYILRGNSYIEQEHIQQIKRQLPPAQEKQIMNAVTEEWKAEGKILASQEILMDTLTEEFGAVPPQVSDDINKIQAAETLRGLAKQARKSASIESFHQQLKQVLAYQKD